MAVGEVEDDDVGVGVTDSDGLALDVVEAEGLEPGAEADTVGSGDGDVDAARTAGMPSARQPTTVAAAMATRA